MVSRYFAQVNRPLSEKSSSPPAFNRQSVVKPQPVVRSNTASKVKSRILKLLDERRAKYRAESFDQARKLGERIDAEVKARECKTLHEIVSAMEVEE